MMNMSTRQELTCWKCSLYARVQPGLLPTQTRAQHR